MTFTNWFNEKFSDESVGEIAKMIGCSRSSVQNWQRGSIPNFFYALEIARAVAFVEDRNFDKVLLEMTRLEK